MDGWMETQVVAKVKYLICIGSTVSCKCGLGDTCISKTPLYEQSRMDKSIDIIIQPCQDS